MFKQLFATMNDVLDQMMTQHPTAVGAKKNELVQQFNVLKAMSDSFIEQWLIFEEKLAKCHALMSSKEKPAKTQVVTLNDLFHKETNQFDHVAFERGQGYFRLYMFDQAIREFEKVVAMHPDFLLARLYLALGYLQTGDYGEAHRHFQFIIPLTDSAKVKAISLNAIGCIQMINKNVDEAYEYFKKAYEEDPTATDPLVNMEVCLYNEGTLHFGTGLAH